MEAPGRKRASRGGRHKQHRCHVCGTEVPFCWSCTCGFQICQACMDLNKWGMSNDVTWICPDCGRMRSF